MRAEEVAGTEELLEESSLQQSKGFLMSKRPKQRIQHTAQPLTSAATTSFQGPPSRFTVADQHKLISFAAGLAPSAK
ncbi:hypothetical protein WJX75_005362 [Coccomyxa subellipsoidea]|uniref:Uncharacterized protein n=1 Tax=Coccomyxa subellipsoidea TaxID=248742 RepID=A0ABR2YVM8_9CHLO